MINFTHQFDQMDCGPACIRMVASAYGKDYPLSYLKSLSHLTREGVSVAGIRDALQEIGMASATFEMTMEQLRDRCPMPAILHWEQNHFVVLYKIKKSIWTKKNYYYIANPAYGKHTFSEEDFGHHWLNGNRGIVIGLEPTEVFYSKDSIRERHSIVNFAQRYVWPFKWEMLQTAIGMLLGIILTLITPFLTQLMVDDGIGMKDMGLIVNLLYAQLFLFVGSFGMNLISSWVSLYMSTRININILEDYIGRLLRLPMTFFETKSVGDYQQRLSDHSRLQSFVTYSSLQTFFSLLSAPALLIVIGYYSGVILIAFLSFTAAATIWMSYFFRKRKSLDYEKFRINSENQNRVYELMSGITDIKVNSYEEYKLHEWKQMQERVYQMNKKSLKLEQIQGTGYSIIGQMRNIIITFWIATEVVNGHLTIGMMMSISNIIGQVSGPLSQLISFLQQLQDAKISLERSDEVQFCQTEDSALMKDINSTSPCDIEFKNLSFSYTGTIGKKALENISFKIPAGKMTAIVGESGSGKTTIMKLLLKFYRPTNGEIFYGDQNIQEYKARAIRMASGIVMQDNFVFSDTIKNNIILGEDENEKKLQEAVDAACLTDFIKGLPLGLETKVGKEGIGLSGGEKQRIMIARAIYKRPLYMMLDEATSSLDAENERQITDNLNTICKGRTLIVIAHRLSTVKNADQIIVLKHGEIVEKGSHSELVAAHGYYYELIKNQLELADES